MDLGESLVGAYLRHIADCDVVVYNSFFRDRQGDIDVVGLRGAPGGSRQIWLCEVTTHIQGMLSVRRGKGATDQVVRDKLGRLLTFAEATFPDDTHPLRVVEYTRLDRQDNGNTRPR